ncbi:MAG: 16S rRNA (uracil(1498)-N(3))-methyltransferase [Cytophagales bacterium]|nr:MAG: 16S rRNA (uracil(1498)-N(3))-methyltransferase [Cytophagales bacterium]
MSHLFIAHHFEADRCTLPEEEALHCLKVLRLRKGDELLISDGKGLWAKGILETDNLKQCTVKLLAVEKNYQTRNYQLHLAIAPTKNIDRMEWLVEKACEVGIDKISFLQCQHSERKQINTERLRKIALQATKQSLKAYIPTIDEMIGFTDFIQKKASSPTLDKYIAYVAADASDKENQTKQWFQAHNLLVMIGPEGDFSPDEVRIAQSAGFACIHFGQSRLRTETAGLYACMIPYQYHT